MKWVGPASPAWPSVGIVEWVNVMDWWGWFGNARYYIKEQMDFAHMWTGLAASAYADPAINAKVQACYQDLEDFWDKNWNALYGEILDPDKNKPRCPCLATDYRKMLNLDYHDKLCDMINCHSQLPFVLRDTIVRKNMLGDQGWDCGNPVNVLAWKVDEADTPFCQTDILPGSVPCTTTSTSTTSTSTTTPAPCVLTAPYCSQIIVDHPTNPQYDGAYGAAPGLSNGKPWWSRNIGPHTVSISYFGSSATPGIWRLKKVGSPASSYLSQLLLPNDNDCPALNEGRLWPTGHATYWAASCGGNPPS